MRKLASIQIIEEIKAIEGADAIERARIKGWWCVVKKGTFKIGDKCVYHEIDSLVPPIDQYSFLSKGTNLKKSIIETGVEVEGYRLKTIRLRGAISQGLALPLSEFKGIIDENITVETDVSGILKIYKYDPPLDASISGDAKGKLPGFLSKTDEIRIQSCTEILDTYKGQHFYATSKIDGTSSTFYKHENVFGACGHTLDFKDSEKNMFWKLARRYDLINRLPDGFSIQGETAGEGIQSNRIRLKGVDFFCFYVFDILKYQYLQLDDMLFFVKDLGLKTVPIVYDDFVLNHSCEDLLKLADVPSPLNPGMPQEGLVFRLKNNTDKISFKVISNEYVLKWGL